MPLVAGIEILHPEQVVLRMQQASASEDLGSFCYQRRAPTRRIGTRLKPGIRMVDLSSFMPERVESIRKAIGFFSDLISDGGLSTTSVASMVNAFKPLLDWADANGYSNCLEGGEATHVAFRAYAASVEERYRRHDLEAPSAWKLQIYACQILEGITGAANLSRGVRLVPTKQNPQGGTEPASEQDFAATLSLCASLFRGLSTLVLESRQYPYKLAMPKSLGWKESFLWTFPTTRWCFPPHLWNEIEERECTLNRAFDYQHGGVSDEEEIWRHCAYTSQRGKLESNGRRGAKKAIAEAEERIAEANRNSRDVHRLRAAMNAHNAFVLLFIAQTGLNFAVVQNLEWSGEIPAGAHQQGFREIKWRASGKEVSAMIRARFLPDLKRFIELRAFLLKGRDFRYLFLSLGADFCSVPSRISGSMLSGQFEILRKINPEIRRLRAQKLRATFHDWYNRNVEQAITAQITGHTEETINKHYQAGSPVAQREELSNFFDKVADKVFKPQNIAPKGASICGEEGPLGTCSAPNSPVAVAGDVPVPPDCQNQNGCLFCRKHLVTADEKDVRKLASCAYVIQQTIYLPDAEAYFRPVLDVIDELFVEIGAFEGGADLVGTVTHDVYENGNLDPYWSEKLSLLDSLEILA
jgi:integrase